jgi:hypothetical protein
MTAVLLHDMLLAGLHRDSKPHSHCDQVVQPCAPPPTPTRACLAASLSTRAVLTAAALGQGEALGEEARRW